MQFALVLAVLCAAVASVAGLSAPTSFTGTHLASHTASAASSALVMRTRSCDLTGKSANRKARVVTFSHTRNHKVQEVNLHTKRMFVPSLMRTVTLRLSTKALRTIDKYGLEEAAKKYDCDLTKF
ncbi:50S ribosomal protein L28 [Tribonema minus]|uniref:50S ribosomal protein L28 n=1 Tax=Tribonema minus TaxID=303371 RepID=A0A835Z921_9STRA|nr:50S ribosomal protein L28 [Tribonema minus]